MTSAWDDAVRELLAQGIIPACPHCQETRLIEPADRGTWYCQVCGRTWEPHRHALTNPNR